MANNYTLGRGKVHVARYVGGVADNHFRYIGNTPELSLTIESETLDHFSSDEGIREKDDSVPLEVNRTGSLTTDNIHPDNIALFFFGEKSTVAQAAVTSAPETFNNVKRGHAYKLGITANRPAGYFGINSAGFSIATTPGAVPLVNGVDYEMNFDMGVLTILDSSTAVLADGTTDIIVTYAVRASTRDRVISGSAPVECAMLYVTQNPKGNDTTFFFPYVKITPNGDYALKGDDWQNIPLSLEILKPTNAEAIYRDGVPVYS